MNSSIYLKFLICVFNQTLSIYAVNGNKIHAENGTRMK